MIDRAAKFLVNAVAPVFGLLLSLWLIWNIETRFFPVVDGFHIDAITLSADGYTASGELNKTRNCEFIGLTLYAAKAGAPKMLLAQYKKDIFGADVGTGRQTWGPWAMKFPARVLEYEHIEVQGTHRCHALWLQTTEYHSLSVKELPQ